jgi:hypothetical protein
MIELREQEGWGEGEIEEGGREDRREQSKSEMGRAKQVRQ